MSLESKNQIVIKDIAFKMAKAGLSEEFITSAIITAHEFEGVYDLLTMWTDETDESQRDEIIGDIQELILDCNKKELMIDNDPFSWKEDSITGAQIRKLAAIPESVQVWQKLSGEKDKLTDLTDIVDLRISGIEYFYTDSENMVD